MRNERTVGLLVMILLGAAVPVVVSAEPGPPPGGGPPTEAYTACSGKSKGDACSFKMHDRDIQGTCDTPPPDAKDSQLACKPSGMPEPPPRN